MSGTAIRETLSVLAVLAGLAFVGVEIRQNNRLARGQARQDLADATEEWIQTLTQDPEYFAVWDRAWIRCEELEGIDAGRASLMMLGLLRRQENVFFQYQEGLVDESALASYGAGRDAPHFQCPRFREFWETRSGTYHPEFVDFFDNSMELRAP